MMVKNNHGYEMIRGISEINILLIDGPNYLDHYKSRMSVSINKSPIKTFLELP